MQKLPSRGVLKDILKICSKFTGGHPFKSVISIKLQSNFIEITLQHVCSPINLLHIFRTPFPWNTPVQLLLIVLLTTLFKYEKILGTEKILVDIRKLIQTFIGRKIWRLRFLQVLLLCSNYWIWWFLQVILNLMISLGGFFI